MEHIRVAVIGMGNMGSAHASCIARGEIAGAVLTAVCDSDRSRTACFAEKHSDVAVFDDYTALLESGGIDAVMIAVPHRLHAKIAAKALEKGVHVLLEKPMDVAISKAKALAETAAASGKIFAIMFNQRTSPLFQRARQIVQSGQLGELKRTVWIVTNWYRTQNYYNSGSWRATWAGEGGGVLLNQAPHNLDLWQWICGMPKSVTAFCSVGKYHNIEVEDDATILTRYENGATGTFITSTGEYPGTNRLEISGDLGKLVLENGVLKWWKLEQSASEVSRTSGENFTSIPFTYEEIPPEGEELAHRGIVQNFVNAILYGEELLSPGEDGIHELMISNAAYLSDWLGNREVQLPLDTEAFDAQLANRVEKSCYHLSGKKFKPTEHYDARWQVKW